MDVFCHVLSSVVSFAALPIVGGIGAGRLQVQLLNLDSRL